MLSSYAGLSAALPLRGGCWRRRRRCRVAFGHGRGERGLALGRELGELAQHGQVAQRAQPEEFEEVRGRPVEQRTARFFFAADHADEVAFEQHLERRARVHAAHVVDLGARDGLAVGHDRERLDLRPRELHGLRLQELPHERRVGRARSELPRPGHLFELHPAALIFTLELVQKPPHLAALGARDARDVLHVEGLLAHEHEALDDALEVQLGDRPRPRARHARRERLVGLALRGLVRERFFGRIGRHFQSSANACDDASVITSVTCSASSGPVW